MRERTRRHPGGRSEPGRDAGFVALGLLSRLVIALALVGTVGFDAISIGASRLSVIDDANTAALAASATWQRTHDIVEAFDSAQRALPSGGGEKVLPAGFTGFPDGTIRLTVVKTARTLVVSKISAFRQLGMSRATESDKAVVS